VVFNNRKGLERTMDSIAAQSERKDLEYIVVDGGSTDGTLDYIRAQSRLIDHWISEPDRGLYHAMNKGLAMARGSYVWFMNSGDALYNQHTLNMVLEAADSGAEFIYGDTMFIDPDGREIGLMSRVTPKKLPTDIGPKTFAYGMNICHQSVVVKRNLAMPYEETYRMVADIDWIIRILQQHPRAFRCAQPLARFELGGISQQRIRSSWKERFQVLRAHYGLWPTLLRHGWLLLRSLAFRLKSGS
jgi:glycosyltransferase involved in cell wall biosynthesis